ncbi:potassium transporter KefB [Flavobacterium terrisoli]|uniref:potassium transporter KefB n=1 Tax=Flavobacterium terrisoli TaxID=3242195 RepID=UPI002542CF3A|nr:potassium transporter KefB [Flavobacterium buctense]
MTQNNLNAKPIDKALLLKRMFLGAGIGLIVISIFVFPTEPKPEWGKFWMIRPLIITPLAGATGGAFSYYMNHITTKGSANRFAANILSVIVFLIGIWMGIVLGLDSTLWD